MNTIKTQKVILTTELQATIRFFEVTINFTNIITKKNLLYKIQYTFSKTYENIHH